MFYVIKIYFILLLYPSLIQSRCWSKTSTGSFLCGEFDTDPAACTKHKDIWGCEWAKVKPSDAVELGKNEVDEAWRKAISDFLVYKHHILSPRYVTALKKDKLNIAEEMQQTTHVAIELIHAFYAKYMTEHAPPKTFSYYILITGSFGRHEMLPSSDLDILPIAIGYGKEPKYTKKVAAMSEAEKQAIIDLFDLSPAVLRKQYPDLNFKKADADWLADQRHLYFEIKATVNKYDVKEYIEAMNDVFTAELNVLRRGVFDGFAFGLDKIINKIVVNDIETLIAEVAKFSVSETKITELMGANQSPISIFGDAEVIYQHLADGAGPEFQFGAIHKKFLHDVQLNPLELMFQQDFLNNFEQAVRDQDIIKWHPKKYTSDEYKPKYLFIRAYSLLVYWNYITLLKTGNYHARDHHFIKSTPARLKQFVQWGLMNEAFADNVIKDFYRQSRFTLVANYIPNPDAEGTYLYSHGQGFLAHSSKGTHGVLLRRREVLNRASMKIFASFGKVMNDIFNGAVVSIKKSKRSKKAEPVKLKHKLHGPVSPEEQVNDKIEIEIPPSADQPPFDKQAVPLFDYQTHCEILTVLFGLCCCLITAALCCGTGSMVGYFAKDYTKLIQNEDIP